MDVNDGKTKTPNLVEKVSKLEKQVGLLLRRLAVLEKKIKVQEEAASVIRANLAQVVAQKAR